MGEHLSGTAMSLRYAGRCRLCGRELPARTRAVYERETRTVRCLECPTANAGHQGTPGLGAPPGAQAAPPAATPGPGSAGSSARREYERRRARDEERLRARYGMFGGLAVALAGERQSTSAWAQGALGEERLGARLDSISSPSVAVLHDRRIPRSRANIDHIVVTPGGIWVIDAKRYRDRTPHLRVEGGLFRPRVEKLYVGSRNCTPLVDGVLNQVDLVRRIVGDGVPVRGVLCFVEASWPLFGGDFTTRGVRVVWPKRLVKDITSIGGVLDSAAVAAVLARALPSA